MKRFPFLLNNHHILMFAWPFCVLPGKLERWGVRGKGIYRGIVIKSVTKFHGKIKRLSFNSKYLLLVLWAMPERQLDCRCGSNFDSTECICISIIVILFLFISLKINLSQTCTPCNSPEIDRLVQWTTLDEDGCFCNNNKTESHLLAYPPEGHGTWTKHLLINK
jgi:hypothetical protein